MGVWSKWPLGYGRLERQATEATIDSHLSAGATIGATRAGDVVGTFDLVLHTRLTFRRCERHAERDLS